jgi:gamma-glutamyltranspeptidase
MARSMSPAEHYAEAEKLMAEVRGMTLGDPDAMEVLAAAQVHATLATTRRAPENGWEI